MVSTVNVVRCAKTPSELHSTDTEPMPDSSVASTVTRVSVCPQLVDVRTVVGVRTMLTIVGDRSTRAVTVTVPPPEAPGALTDTVNVRSPSATDDRSSVIPIVTVAPGAIDAPPFDTASDVDDVVVDRVAA